MAFDFRRFTLDYSIRYYTDGYKQCGDGWLQINCPFCTGSPGPHLGWNTHSDYFSCWRCSGLSHAHVIHGLLGVPYAEAFNILREYQGRPGASQAVPRQARAQVAECKLPTGTGPMDTMHTDYLEARRFRPDDLVHLWRLQGTNHMGAYKFRIIIPYYYQGRIVTYQGRDVTDKSELKYKGCAIANEVISQKAVLYGMDNVLGDTIVIVEGPTDVWRLGPGAVATFGLAYLPAQVELMRGYKKRYICFDAEPAAAKAAQALAGTLSAFPGTTEIITLDKGDPGDMAQDDANTMMEDLLGGLG